MSMMEENEKMEPIAKLEQQEFCLDLEELERLHDESEEEVAKVGRCLPEAPKWHETHKMMPMLASPDSGLWKQYQPWI